jgi:hypothetical protein
MTGLTAELAVDGREPVTPEIAPDGRLLCYVLAPVTQTVTTSAPSSGWPTPTSRRRAGRHRDGVPTEEHARRARDRDDAILVGTHEPRARLRLLDLRTGHVTSPDGLGDRHVVEVRQRPDGGPLAVLTPGRRR